MSDPTAAIDQTLSGTKIALVCGHFSPEIGYQEVDLATTFARLGADVLVVTSTRPSRNARALVQGRYPIGITLRGAYRVLRLEPKLTIGSNVLGCSVLPAVQDFGPDYVVLVGPGKLFGLDLFAAKSAPWKRVAIAQDNSDDGRAEGSLVRKSLRAVAHRTIKRRAYRRVVRNADRLVMNVPETREIVTKWLGRPERERLSVIARDLRLGFDPELFFYDREGRRRWRARHDVTDDEILLVTCTRATPNKRLEEVIDAVAALRRLRRLPVRFVLAGLQDDDYGQMLRRHAAAAQRDPRAFVLLPILRHVEMRELFSAGDIGFWPRAAITIQQSMGTGLPVVLRRRPSVSHLVVEGRNGWYVRDDEPLDRALERPVADIHALGVEARSASRDLRATLNRSYLSYEAIVHEIVQGLRGRP